MTKRTQYTDDFRAGAVAMLEGAGYPTRKGALSEVAKHLNVQPRTLSRWFNGEQNPPPDRMVNEKRLDLTELIETEIRAIFDEMKKAREFSDYKALGTVLGILVDKKQLLTGKPTERTESDVVVTDAKDRLARILADRAERQRTSDDSIPTHANGSGTPAV